MKKKIFSVCIMISVVFFAANLHAAKKNVISAIGGTPIQQLGIIIDASYDKKLDRLIPGYKVINVALINQSLQIIPMDPEKDAWTIGVSGKSGRIKAIHDLRKDEPKLWAGLSDRAKTLVGYPLVLPVGAQEVVDIFVPSSVDAANFNELSVYFKAINTKIDVTVRQ